MRTKSPYQIDRERGYSTHNGHLYQRQTGVGFPNLMGKPTRVSFTLDQTVAAVYQLIEADILQPAHLGGSINPLHFLPEAQPRNRALSASGALTPERIAQDLRPEELMGGATAYTGAPVVNPFGEVIQGNGRAWAIKLYYRQFPDDPRGYRAALAELTNLFNAKELAERLPEFRQPVLVRHLTGVDTDRQIQLGQYTQADNEAVAATGSKSKSKARLLTPLLLRKITGELLVNDDPDKTLTELIRESRILPLLVREKVLASGDMELYTRQGVINEAGVTFVSDLLLTALFADADRNATDLFFQSPMPVQNIIRKATVYLLRVSPSRRIGRELGNAVVAYNEYQRTGLPAFANWVNQLDIGGKSPVDRFSSLELKLADLLSKSVRQRDVVEKLRSYADAVTPQAATMFTDSRPGMTKTVAAKTIFGASYRPDDTRKLASRKASRVKKGIKAFRGKHKAVKPAPAPVETENTGAPGKRGLPALFNVGWKNTTPLFSMATGETQAVSMQVAKKAESVKDRQILTAARASAKHNTGYVCNRNGLNYTTYPYDKYVLFPDQHYIFVFSDGETVWVTPFKLLPPSASSVGPGARAQALARAAAEQKILAYQLKFL